MSVPANDSVLLTVTGTDTSSAHYVPVGSRFTGVTAAATGLAVATFTYTGGGTATLAVNGQQPTVLAFPPGGSSVSAIVSLGKGTNTLTFSGTPPQLSDVSILPLPGSNGVQVAGTQSGRCLDVNDNSITNGVQAQLWDCAAGPNQTWTPARGQLVVNGTKCLDAYNSGTTNGTAVVIWDCNGQRNQQWTLNANGTITNALSGLCLDASGAEPRTARRSSSGPAAAGPTSSGPGGDSGRRVADDQPARAGVPAGGRLAVDRREQQLGGGPAEPSRSMSMLVSGGRQASAMTSQLSKPTSATSPGTRRPASCSASARPRAIWSLPQNTASNSVPAASRMPAACRPHASLHSPNSGAPPVPARPRRAVRRRPRRGRSPSGGARGR